MTHAETPRLQRSSLASIRAYQGSRPRISDNVFLADGARIIGNVDLAPLVGVWFNVVIRGDVNVITIGEGTNIQDNAVVHCTSGTGPTHIGRRVTVGHAAVVHGCTVEDECLIGMQAVILDGAVIGTQSIVGAGAVVTQGTHIPPRSLVVGAPARVVRQLRDEEIASLHRSAENYIQYASSYTFEE